MVTASCLGKHACAGVTQDNMQMTIKIAGEMVILSKHSQATRLRALTPTDNAGFFLDKGFVATSATWYSPAR